MNNTFADAVALREALLAQLQPAPADAIRSIVDEAARHAAVYAAGGAVRDLLLGRTIGDIDLVTEGDAIAITRAALPRARVTAHQRFRTASAVIDGARIDVATSRRETYARPGALPRVEPAPIDEDLMRRDFSVNAIALRLDEPAFIDPSGGRADLAVGVIRVLHARSFIDDPTRIYRAFRYAARLGFALEPVTQRLLHDGLAYVATVGGERLRRELELIIGEPVAGEILQAVQGAGVLQATHSALHWSDEKTRALRSDPAQHVARVPFVFGLLAAGASPEDAASLIDRLRLTRDEAAAVRGVSALRSAGHMLRRPDVKPSGVVVLLDRYPPAAIAAYALTTGETIARQLALRYLDEWRHVRPLLRGDDLIGMGVPAGPQVHRGLQLIRAARLDGWAGDRAGERALVARFAKSIRDSRAATAPLELDLGD
jgi:tRNA nucleotidyltransferase (CCA-adding enzyme)